ncbi:MAG: hypothetical protein K6G00_00315 [Treponema sp.]|nr:hypothetical protein [Treponema sp.]
MFGRFFASVKNATVTAGKTLAASGLFICIITTICASIELLSYRHSIAGIIISSLICSLLTVPLTIICLQLFKNTEQQDQKNSFQAEQELNSLKKEKNDYKRKLLLLENLSFNMITYQDVLKMCFRDYRQEGIIKQREQFNEEDYSNPIKKFLEMPSKNYDEVLSIIDWLVTYQRGVDLKNIKIAKVNDDTVIISGITPEFTTQPHFEYKDFCTEIRHVKLDKNGETKQISIENGEKARSILNNKTSEYKKMLEESFSKGGKPDEDAIEIRTRAQDFIRIILQPIYKNIEFEEEAVSSSSMPFLEFLTAETNSYKKLLEKENQVSAE